MPSSTPATAAADPRALRFLVPFLPLGGAVIGCAALGSRLGGPGPAVMASM
jgi:hypothetical protein